uniref:Eukaryotic translation initiation factor 3 subunit G n=1 Tax=Macrostomum lignano TaxID=282301 RepID=A0A1I8GQ76_9PLAT
ESAEPSTDQLEPKQQPAVSTAGYAAVKPEYLLPPAPAPVAEFLVNGQQQQTEQSKSRKRRPYLPDRPAECRSYFADGVCHFGVTCRLSHDLPAYLATRPPDLGPSCFVFDTTGRCPSGALCRFAGAHVDADGRNLADPDRQRTWAAAGQTELHGLDRDLQLALRRDDFDFGEAYALLLAPLTTVGNLPFRRVCVDFGADVTCGEMAMASNLLQGRNAEWALLRRHPSERCFGAQVCGSHPDQLARLAQLLRDRAPHLDFVDLNCGCPIDLVYQRGMGAGMLTQPKRLETSVSCMAELLNCPLTVKVRTGVREGVNVAHELLPRLRAAGAAAVTIHGRSREQRYRRLADWDYIGRCTAAAKAALQDGSAAADDDDFFVIGNGDVFSPADLEAALATGVDAVMVARGALVKPWLFTELRDGRLWDISSSERMDLLRRYVNYGLLHWGSDAKGVETVRRFFLEWQSFLCRYVPLGLLERPPQRSNERPPAYFGRDDLETLMASQRSEDWVRLSAMLLGPPPPGFTFTPKHKASAETCRQLTMSDWAKEMEEAEQLEYQLPPPVMEYNKDKSIKREISYQRDENGNLFKVSSELQVEVRKLSKSIARRKEWKKFGAAESDGPGPNSANTYPAEEVFLQFVSGRPEDEAEKQADELVSKMPKNVATCRICRGSHFTTRCPFKDRQDSLDVDEQAMPIADTSNASAASAAAANGGVGSSNAGIPIFKEAGGKYVPPGLRQAAASGVGSPVGADKRRDDQPTIRVTNLPEDTTEEDLGHLFNPFGKIQRIFLAKDKQTMASKGFAFITYQRKEDAQKAIFGVSGFGYGHLILKVDWAKPSND